MITVLIEENYAKNSRVGLILDGILSVTRRKRVAVEVYTDEKKIKSKPRVVVLICASLKWATEIIEKFNEIGLDSGYLPAKEFGQPIQSSTDLADEVLAGRKSLD